MCIDKHPRRTTEPRQPSQHSEDIILLYPQSVVSFLYLPTFEKCRFDYDRTVYEPASQHIDLTDNALRSLFIAILSCITNHLKYLTDVKKHSESFHRERLSTLCKIYILPSTASTPPFCGASSWAAALTIVHQTSESIGWSNGLTEDEPSS